MSSPSQLAPPAVGEPRPLNERGLLYTLAGIQFTHIVDFMVMMPLGPSFTRLFGISDAQFGLLVSAYTLAAGASGLVASLFVDRFERKRLLLWMYAGFALATLACGLAPGYALLLVARIAAGLFGGVMGTLVQTMVGDAIPFARRGAAMGVVMASFSLATVAGVPASLYIANLFGWNAPFIGIAVASLLIGAVGLRTLPRLDGHLQAADGRGAWQTLGQVLGKASHWRAFGLTALIMAMGFTTIPYLTIYMTANMGLATTDVPLVYLAGGVATLFTARMIGKAADRWGKVRVFRIVASVAVLPVLAVTNAGVIPLALLLVITTLFFVFVSGRFVPGMALITAAVAPPLRGTFMSLNSAVQSASMGVAATVGGMLIGRNAAGQVTGYAWCGWIALALTVASVWWVGKLDTPETGAGPRASPGG